jgi:hypothetical protein
MDMRERGAVQAADRAPSSPTVRLEMARQRGQQKESVHEFAGREGKTRVVGQNIPMVESVNGAQGNERADILDDLRSWLAQLVQDKPHRERAGKMPEITIG